MYCGNNALNPQLTNGTKVLGTRYGCLLKGKQKGLEDPVDPTFKLPYSPIDKTKKYCGNKIVLPDGYNRFGGLYECYLKGLGVGKRLKATQSSSSSSSSSSSFKFRAKKDNNNYNNNLNLYKFLIFYGIMNLTLFIFIYYTKPPFILKNSENNKNNENKKEIDWYKFILFMIILVVFSFLYVLIKYA